MKNIKKIVFAILIILILLILLLLFNNKILGGKNEPIQGNEKEAIGITDISKDSYGYPLISYLEYSNKKIVVHAGIYRYGDVNQDGIIDLDDKDAISTMIEFDNLGFTSGQIKLADLDENGKITNNDLKMLEQYLKKNGTIKYSLNEQILKYCISEKNSSSNCVWKSDKSLTPSKQKDYYVFVKMINNGRISESMLFEKGNMNTNLSI